MKWIKITERLPTHGKSALVENQSGAYYKMEFNGSVHKDWYERNLKRWLDEESNEPVFCLADLNKVWEKAKVVMCDYLGESSFIESEYVDERKKIFFKEQFKIEIP